MSVQSAYLAVLVIWATTPLGVAWSSETIHPLMAAWLRMAIAALLGWLLVRALRLELPWHRAALRSYACATLGIFGAMAATYTAVQYIPSGLISVIFGLSPMISALLAQLLLDEAPFAPHRWCACLLGIAGLGWIFLDGSALGPGSGPGVTLLLLAALLFSLSGVLVKREGLAIHPLSQTVGALLLSLPAYGLLWALLDGSAPQLDFDSHSPWAILYLAVFGSLVGFVSYFHILSRLPPSTVALVTLVTPVFALLLGSWLNGEVVTASTWGGTAVILAGLSIFFWGGRLQLMRL
ncbi:membrane protein [Marinobacterium nitratireducens]|uniref:Membrane protein n=1 Tax=Marinobacterium nitratireducens TaxID=518897 RepID=A0A918DQ82_9GAMM|nr:DMT family transporter [Marinobacterium nitratireducens]GGO78198.1 membrane protein [Marinobacterium nitratireducens]